MLREVCTPPPTHTHIITIQHAFCIKDENKEESNTYTCYIKINMHCQIMRNRKGMCILFFTYTRVSMSHR